MAKKTNKTDHVLNLLSSGKKGSAKEENDAPPVDLRRKAPEPPEEPLERPSEEELPEPKVTAEPEPELPEPRVLAHPEEENLPEPRMSSADEDSLSESRMSTAAEESLPEPRMTAGSEKAPETKVTVEMTPPKASAVSVVRTSGDENPIADAVKDSLEAEFNEYLREKGEIPAEPETERLIEWEIPKPKERTEINVFELMRESEEEAATQAEPVVEQEVVETTVPEPKIEPEAATPEPEAEHAPEPVMMVADHDSVPEPEEPSEPEPEPVPVPMAGAPDDEPELAPEPATGKPEKAPEPIAPEEESMEEKDYTMVNVMEYLVRDQVPRYIRQFGHCDCDRCIEDTVALTLTHLPAKYVVVNKNAVSPLLNFYEKKYAGQLIVEITKATMIVNESPNH